MSEDCRSVISRCVQLHAPTHQDHRERLPSPPAAVVCRGVTKSFGDGDRRSLALQGIHLDVHFGRTTMIVGPSGCGKSTLLLIIAGFLAPTEGFVEVLGQRPPLVRQQASPPPLGFVFQNYNLIPTLTAAENVAVPLIIAGARRGDAMQRAKKLLAQVDLQNRADALPRELSGGQQQRVSIARALVGNPLLIICDEPTAALDHCAGRIVMDLLREVAVSDERAVLVVTHDDRILHYAHTIAHLDDGVVTRVDTRN